MASKNVGCGFTASPFDCGCHLSARCATACAGISTRPRRRTTGNYAEPNSPTDLRVIDTEKPRNFRDRKQALTTRSDRDRHYLRS